MAFRKKLALLALMTATAPSHAETPHDGNRLLKECGQVITRQGTDPKDFLGAASCMGTLRGAIAINAMYRVALSDKEDKALFCPPDNATIGQSVRVVVKYLEDHPAELHEQDSLLIVKALDGAFPCPGAGR